MCLRTVKGNENSLFSGRELLHRSPGASRQAMVLWVKDDSIAGVEL